jgi:hypothetical protein
LAGGSPGLEWLCAQPLASIEMQRRRVLIAARGGAAIDVPPQLGVPAPDHRNAEVWRAHFRDRMFIARDDLGSLAPLHDR